MQIVIDTILSDIAVDNKNGATALATRGLDAMAMLAEVLPENAAQAEYLVIDLIRRLDAVRPSMGAIGVQALLAADKARALVLSSGGLWSDALRQSVKEEKGKNTSADEAIAGILEDILAPEDIIVTCSSSATVEKAILAVSPKRVRIGEGQGLGDGLALAKRLGEKNLPVEVVPDGALPVVVAGSQAVLIGADQVLEDGSVVNRCSSFSLALAANHYNVPLYVTCQQIKLTGRTEAHLEEWRSAFQNLPDGVTGYAPIFDVTPPDLIHQIITENGQMTASEAGSKGKKVAAMLTRILATGKF
jgi:translation initiation factor 2B subunit (eIF-2B alpha/beta/delta family)